jgi:segregation and condensation protein A
MSNQQFHIKSDHFEGPLDVLLTLIEKRKLLINEISLAQVTDDYITYINSKEKTTTSIAESSEFILVASTLLLIKSKSLLPTLSLTQEETESVSDLERRLAIYKRIKDASIHVEELFGAHVAHTPQKAPKLATAPAESFAPSDNISTASLIECMQSLRKSLPKVEKVPEAVIKKIISLEESMQKLTKRITSNLQMSFKEFSGHGKEEKVNVIVSFLAMLELVKQGMLSVQQHESFDDIHMETKDIQAPQYT